MRNAFYIFLDIDGVLTTKKFREKLIKNLNISTFEACERLDPINVSAFNFLLCNIKKEGYTPKIVISSSRRNNKEFKQTVGLLKENLTEYEEDFDRTSFNHRGHRGKQIEEFVKENKLKNFVIIDDFTMHIDECFSKDFVIETKESKGLTPIEVREFVHKFRENEAGLTNC